MISQGKSMISQGKDRKMQIKDYQCKCGSKEFFALKKDESHVGIYCQSCGRWYKWADKNEKNLIAWGLIQHD